jgi:hypothetical protein
LVGLLGNVAILCGFRCMYPKPTATENAVEATANPATNPSHGLLLEFPKGRDVARFTLDLIVSKGFTELGVAKSILRGRVFANPPWWRRTRVIGATMVELLMPLDVFAALVDVFWVKFVFVEDADLAEVLDADLALEVDFVEPEVLAVLELIEDGVESVD